MARILFIEDEFIIRLTACEVIADAGHRVTEADSLESARRILSDPAADFDLLAINIELPDGNGIDLCDELRRSGCELPVLMHSGHAQMSMVVRAMRAGGTDYLTKPYTPKELLERIDFLLDMPSVVQTVIRPHGGRGSNISSPQAYTDPRVASALVRLQDVRPLPGTLPVQGRGQGEEERQDVRTVPLDETEASKLQAVLEDIRDLLKQEKPDPEKVDMARAALVGPLNSISSWLGQRATVVTDEALKKFTTLAIAAFAAQALGLKLDLMHIIAALAALGGFKL